jgi:hypothetical protein
MSKRQKFIIATIILALGIVAIRYPFLQWRYRVLFYALAAGGLSLWGLMDPDLKGVKRLMIPALPALFAISAALTFPLLPANFDSFLIWEVSHDTGLIFSLGLRLIFLAIFAVAYYAAMLCGNIYNVASLRTIQLLRAAHTVGFIVALLSAAFLFQVVASFHLSSFYNFILVFIISLPIFFVNLWAINLEETIGKRVIIFSAVFALIVAQIAWVTSFWPLTVVVWSLFLTAAIYVLAGLAQYYLSERLFLATIREFIVVTVVILILIIFTAAWKG